MSARSLTHWSRRRAARRASRGRRLPVRVLVHGLVLALGPVMAACGPSPARQPLANGALNVADEAHAPRPVRCRSTRGAPWSAADDARLVAIAQDSAAPASARAARLRAAWPQLTTFEAIEARACRALAGGRILSAQYATLVDSVVPALLDAIPGSAADSSFRRLQPRPRDPAPGTVFDVSPRRTVVRWDSVPGAVHYLLEVNALVSVYHRSANGGDPVFDHDEWMPHGDGLHSATTRRTRAVFYFIGAQPGRWRVRAIGPGGVASRPSEWREFTHTR